MRRIANETPDVAVLTEARVGHLESLGGFEVASESPPEDRFDVDERKVLMWSQSPWCDVDQVGDRDMPTGRFVAATTATSIGDVRVIGVCIPWHMCDVRTGTEDRRPWEQHRRWLELFEVLIASDPATPVVIAGDFNQRVPRSRSGPRAMAELLDRVFTNHTIVTGGVVEGCDRQGIDHIAIDPRLAAIDVRGWPHDHGGVRMSDHDGVGANVALR